MDNIPSLVSDMDDLEVESIWGKDHYRIREDVTCYCAHGFCGRCGRWLFCAGKRACHGCGEGQ